MILSIESSCDDSSLALTRIADHKLLFHTKLSQDSHHSPFGGVVPEIASRLHAQNLPMLLEKIKDFLCATYNTRTPFAPLKAIAIANRPGLSVTLSEGMCMANTLALSLEIPLLCLNHLKGHIYSLFIDKPTQIGEGLGVLLVSGGHTQILHIRDYHHITLVAQSLDDSFGESFDKVAKMLSLGYPGGPIVESYAKNYSGTLLPMPIPLLHDKRLAYSFSGLKNAVRLKIAKAQDNLSKEQICASFQEAACTHILHKLRIYFQQYSDSFTHFGVVGGASANTLLRTKIESLCQEFDKTLLLAPLEFCADNAAMIGRLACEAYAHKEFSPLSDTISPKSFPEDFYKDC